MPGPVLRNRLLGWVYLPSKTMFQWKAMGCAVQPGAWYASAERLWVLCHWEAQTGIWGVFAT